MSKIATLPRAEEVEDDGFVTHMPREAAAVVADGRNAAPAPQTRSERFHASLAAQKSEAEAELAGIEAQIIATEEVCEQAGQQARAEYERTVAAAKAKLDKMLSRLTEDRDQAIDELTASKADIIGVVNMLNGALERAAEGGAA